MWQRAQRCIRRLNVFWHRAQYRIMPIESIHRSKVIEHMTAHTHTHTTVHMWAHDNDWSILTISSAVLIIMMQHASVQVWRDKHTNLDNSGILTHFAISTTFAMSTSMHNYRAWCIFLATNSNIPTIVSCRFWLAVQHASLQARREKHVCCSGRLAVRKSVWRRPPYARFTYAYIGEVGRATLYTTTTTTQRGWCMEAFVSILAHLQSHKFFPGGGGV